MDFQAWLTANAYDGAALSETQRKHLEAAWKAETQPAAPAPKPTSFDETMSAIEAENNRVCYIQEATARCAQANIGNPEKVKQLRDLCDSAIADKKTDPRSFDLSLLRVERMLPPMVMAPRSQQITDEVVEAAACMTAGLQNVEKYFQPQTLEVAHKRFKHGLGLQELLMVAAERNSGFRGSHRDTRGLLKAAFRENAEPGDYGFRADVSPSTLNITGILSNIANKFLRVAFEGVESSWRKICTIRPCNDFKTLTSYSLTGDNVYEEVGAGGEIKSGSLGETSYTNQAKTYAKLLGLDRRDVLNDDIGALNTAGRRLGRGAALKLNTVFWAAWLADSAFFTAGNVNYDAGATDSVLSLAGLVNADTIFRAQTNPQAPGDPAASPLGLIPKILLVPTALRTTAWNLMNSEFVNLVTATTAVTGTSNPWRGQFEPVDSIYLSLANGGSDLAWYLLADPNDLSAIEVCFLFGAEMPTIETSEMDFDRLGIAMRGYHDFGVSLQEYRAAVKLKGAA